MATADIGTLRTRLSWEDDGNKAGMEGLKRDLKGLRSEMNLARSGGKDYTNSLKGMREQSNILTRQFKTQETQVKELRKRHKELTDAGKEDTVAAKNLESQINNTTAQMNRTEGQLKRLNDEIRRMESPWTKIGETMTKTGDTMQKVGRGMTSFGKEYSMKVTAPIVAGGVAMFKASMDYESAFAGVRKTVDDSEEGYAKLSEGIRNMAKELPTSATAIAGVAEAAGQLGIENESILGFTRTMIDLGEATNMTADTAATEFARFANIVGMSQDDFDKLGSVVVDLGNNLATTEGEIVNMAMRLAGAGAQIGLTEAEIMAFSGALSSVGIEAEAGGSAFSKVMVNMQLAAELGGDDLKAFADVAGVSANDFKKSFEDDAAGAMISFIKGLENAEDRGMSAIAVLDDMGITEVRMRDALLRAAGASDVFTDSIEMGSKAWEENTALTEEAEQRYGTTESQLKIMWNRIKDVAITLGDALVPAVMDAIDAAAPLIEKIEDGAQAFADMTEEEQQSILKMVALVAAIGPASIVLGGLTTAVGGVLKVGGGVATMLGAAGGKGLIGRIGLMGASTGPVGLAVGGVALLAGGIYALNKVTEINYEKTSDAIDKRLEELDSLDASIERYEELQDKNNLTTDSMLRYMDVMDELKDAKNEETIKKLTDEQAYLLEMSGLTNEEMSEFLDLNGTLVETAPATAEAISSQGNAYLVTLDALKELTTAEREREQTNLYATITDEMDEQVKRLDEQAERQQTVIDLENEHSEVLGRITESGRAIRDIDEELAGLDAEQLGLSIEQRDEIRAKILELKTERDVHDAIVEAGNEELVGLEKQVDKEQDKLDEVNKQIDGYNQLIDQYEAILLSQTDIVDEQGESYQSIQDARKGLQDQRAQLELLHNDQKISTTEYEEGIKKIEGQEEALGGVQREADILNDKLGEDIDKKVGINTSPTINALNRDLTSPITRIMNIRTYGATPIAANADGTDFHPGGLSWLGEEGPELIRKGSNWAMADFGLYDLPRGYQVFTNDESKRIMGAMNRLPAYASGISPSGEANRVVNQLNNQPMSDSSGQVVALLRDIAQGVREGKIIEVSGQRITSVVNETNAVSEVGNYF